MKAFSFPALLPIAAGFWKGLGEMTGSPSSFVQMDQFGQVRSWRAAVSPAGSGTCLLFNCCFRREQAEGIRHLPCTQPDPAGACWWVSTHGSTTELPFPGYCIPAGAGLGAPAEQLALPRGLWAVSAPGFGGSCSLSLASPGGYAACACLAPWPALSFGVKPDTRLNLRSQDDI